MRWFEKQRLDYIAYLLRTKRYLNRADLTSKFHISDAQAAADIATYKTLHESWMEPGLVYNKSSKRYETAPIPLIVPLSINPNS